MSVGPPSAIAQTELAGFVSLEPRVFFDAPLFPEQPGSGLSPSAVLAPELHLEWNDGDSRFSFSPYLRLDADDSERTHFDIREAYWLHVKGPWTWQLGIGRVFWGVTESRHLVDIVNQTDFVEDIDEEDKLGQPMVMLERWSEQSGSLALFLLPGFRERTFPAADARLRGAVPIAASAAEYESGAGNHRLDWAIRWSQVLGNWDIGTSIFHGTGREPNLLPRLDSDGEPILVPRYDAISQVGADIQYTRNAWLLKLEGLWRKGQGQPYWAYVTGAEYTLYGFGGSGADLGVLAEYQYDGRDEDAPPTYYDDNWFVGLRLALNDAQDTSLVTGAIVGSSGTFAIAEAARRLGENWKVELELRLFADIDMRNPLLAGYQNDSFVALRIARYL